MTINFISTFHQPAGSYLSDTLQTLRLANDIHVDMVDWRELWPRLKSSIYNRHGSEVAEIGTTWVASLQAMDALSAIDPYELLQIGQASDFIAPSWQTAFVPGDSRVWAIPWTAEVRLIFYWQDLFDQAGLDTGTAFTTPPLMEAAFEQVQSKTGITPWVTHTVEHSNLMLYAAPWLWGAGGEFFNVDGTHTRFVSPEALRGMNNYFRLHRFLPPKQTPISRPDIRDLFATRQVGATIAGTWLFQHLRDNFSPDQLARVAVALPPGPPFVGGSNLILMKHLTPVHRIHAIKFIAHLISPEVQAEYNQLIGGLPVRTDVLNTEPWSTSRLLAPFVQALKIGRSVPVSPLWGVIEDRLDSALAEIWSILRENPNENLEQVIAPRMQQLAQRIDAMLE